MSLTKSTLKKTLKPLSQVIARKDLLRGIVSDLCLLHGLGVRLVVALGTKPQVDGRLSRSGAQSKFVDGYRVTDAAALSAAVEVSSFANLSRALLPSSSGNASLSWRCVDYSRQPLSLDPAARERLARKLLAAGLALEASFGGPQDVEGCLPAGLEEEGRIWIVQARPQPGA